VRGSRWRFGGGLPARLPPVTNHHLHRLVGVARANR